VWSLHQEGTLTHSLWVQISIEVSVPAHHMPFSHTFPVPKSYSFGKTKLATCNLGIGHVPATSCTRCTRCIAELHHSLPFITSWSCMLTSLMLTFEQRRHMWSIVVNCVQCRQQLHEPVSGWNRILASSKFMWTLTLSCHTNMIFLTVAEILQLWSLFFSDTLY
jgi:hypothetical protein